MIVRKDTSHKNTCVKHYGASGDPKKPCACASLPPIAVSDGELQQMAADGRGRSSIVCELAKQELVRRSPLESRKDESEADGG